MLSEICALRSGDVLGRVKADCGELSNGTTPVHCPSAAVLTAATCKTGIGTKTRFLFLAHMNATIMSGTSANLNTFNFRGTTRFCFSGALFYLTTHQFNSNNSNGNRTIKY